MTRIRTLKPEIWQDEAFGELTHQAQLLFIGLITQADDEGRLKGSPSLIRSQVFPYKHGMHLDSVEAWLEELEEASLIERYDVGGRPFINLPTWHRHQRVSHPSESLIPTPSPNGSAPDPEHSGGAPESSGAAREDVHREGKGREGNKETATSASADRVLAIFNAWIDATGRTSRTVLSTKRRRLIRKALEDYTVDELVAAVRGWRHSPHHRGENKTSTVYNDIELLLRDAEHIERFRDLEKQHGEGGSWRRFLGDEG